jgi:DNA-binding MarR family transcriptional regulator
MPDQPQPDLFFAFFQEVGILAQLSRARFEAQLPAGLTLSQFTVLNHLVRVRDGRTPLELARAFQVPKTSMTHSLAVLDRLGLIRLAPHERDGRSKCVWITDEGRAVRERVLTEMAPVMADLAARFPSGRIAEALPVLADLRRLMDQLRDLA